MVERCPSAKFYAGLLEQAFSDERRWVRRECGGRHSDIQTNPRNSRDIRMKVHSCSRPYRTDQRLRRVMVAHQAIAVQDQAVRAAAAPAIRRAAAERLAHAGATGYQDLAADAPEGPRAAARSAGPASKAALPGDLGTSRPHNGIPRILPRSLRATESMAASKTM